MAVQKIRIKLAAYDHELVDEAANRIVETMKKSGAKISGPIPLPTEREIVTILRSPHKYKDSREQFEMRTHKRLIDVIKPSKAAVEALTPYRPCSAEREAAAMRSTRTAARSSPHVLQLEKSLHTATRPPQPKITTYI